MPYTYKRYDDRMSVLVCEQCFPSSNDSMIMIQKNKNICLGCGAVNTKFILVIMNRKGMWVKSEKYYKDLKQNIKKNMERIKTNRGREWMESK